jgi:hypothetical protein
MISAMAKGYQVFREARYLQSAETAASFALATLYDQGGKVLYHRYRDGEVGISGNLDDYAFLTQGLLDLYEASFTSAWLEAATELQQLQTALFADSQNGGFFDTSGEDKTVLLRMKEDYDGAEPAGNSVAALNLLRLGGILGRDDLLEGGEKTVCAFADQLEKSPTSMPHMLSSFAFQLAKNTQIVIAGRRGDAGTEKMLQQVFTGFLPNKAVYLAEAALPSKAFSAGMDFLAEMVMLDDKATAYVCHDYTCQQPTNDLGVLQATLRHLYAALK